MFSWLRRALGLDPGFSELELKILHEFAATLDADSRTRWIARIEHINLVQRSPDGREVNCYSRRKGQVLFPPADQLCESDSELVFGEVELRMRTGKSVVARLWVVRGYFFSIEYSEPLRAGSEGFVSAISVISGPNYPMR